MTSGASSDPKVAVAIKHWGVAFVVLDDEVDVVGVWEAEEVVWVNELVVDSVAEETIVVADDDDVEVEVARVTTVNCVWLCPLAYPGLLAETYVVYCP